MTYFINYNNGLIDDGYESIESAKTAADQAASYTQESIVICDNNGKEVVSRYWYGCTDGVEEFEDPIQFGNYGFYTDWIED